MTDKDRSATTVFVSSTNIDLAAYREQAAMAAHAAGLLPICRRTGPPRIIHR
jgi:hypothetical protein